MLSNRMREYENTYSQKLDSNSPVLVRLDGKGFSKFTKPFKYPFDQDFRKVFSRVGEDMMKEFNAKLCYHQSDELSLLFYKNNNLESFLFDGKVNKLNSVLSSYFTSRFLLYSLELFPNLKEYLLNNLPVFDCRCWNVPDLDEAFNYFLWRELDCKRNSLNMLVKKYYSTKELHGRSYLERLELVKKEGDNYEDYPRAFKLGTYLKFNYENNKRKVVELNDLPELLKLENRLSLFN